ncbi:MAG TPA: biosynthetic peptidoglycan transglycosylase [Candidatus Dormibacteraeota bacterium]|nr:biosynthetic peptidoglycan transglycosylase [Candidatus Dormibacteraeota bacterium]
MPTPVNVGRVVAVIAVLVAVVAPVVATLWVSTPDVSDVQARVAALTRAHGVVLLAPDQVPDLLAKAVVATEDERFYAHHGIDTVGLARAALFDVANRCFCQGGSTITQQLVKQLYLNGSDRGRDKITDMVLALKVETVLSKKQIMADYLSEISTGLNRYGVTEAACAYFKAPLAGLTLGQYALLAGVTQAPSIYDPTVNPDAAQQRRGQVLRDMVSEGYITAAQATAAEQEPVLAANRTSTGC